jgi:NADH dehydrogenase
VGAFEVKRFSADITGSPYSAVDLLRLFRARFKEVMPVDVGVEPVSAQEELTQGAEITMALPGRGHVQIRIEEVADDHVVGATLRGHSLAGIVLFSAQSFKSGVRFEVTTCHTAANAFDWLMLTLGGARLQDANWTRLVQNVVKLAGGVTDGVQSSSQRVTGDERQNLERWIDALAKRQAAGRSATRG